MRRVSIGPDGFTNYLIHEEKEKLQAFIFSTIPADRLAGIISSQVKSSPTFPRPFKSSLKKSNYVIPAAAASMYKVCGFHLGTRSRKVVDKWTVPVGFLTTSSCPLKVVQTTTK